MKQWEGMMEMEVGLAWRVGDGKREGGREGKGRWDEQ